MAKQVTEWSTSVEKQGLTRCKPYLAFSIDSILGRNDETTINSTNIRKEKHEKKEALEHKTSTTVAPIDYKSVAQLPWLSYTRYSPPKLPRSRRKAKNCKRRSSGSPRVPFSSTQLMTLEQTYTENRYLSGSQVAELGTSLNLPHHRIKIWFQNRRAREKRSQEETPVSAVSGECPPLQQYQIGINHDASCCVPFSLSASFPVNYFALRNYTSHYNVLSRCVNFDAYGCGSMDF